LLFISPFSSPAPLTLCLHRAAVQEYFHPRRVLSCLSPKEMPSMFLALAHLAKQTAGWHWWHLILDCSHDCAPTGVIHQTQKGIYCCKISKIQMAKCPRTISVIALGTAQLALPFTRCQHFQVHNTFLIMQPSQPSVQGRRMRPLTLKRTADPH
jgi:hypothetical protein